MRSNIRNRKGERAIEEFRVRKEENVGENRRKGEKRGLKVKDIRNSKGKIGR